MGRLGELLLFAALSYGRFRLRDHCFGALYRGAEFLALPSIDRMAVVERLVCGVLRTRDQLTKRRNGLGEQLGVRSVSGRLRHLYNPSHRNFGPPCSIVTNDDSCNCPLVIAVKRDSAAPSLALAGGHLDEGASASRFQRRWRRSNRALASGCAAICHVRGHRLACSDRTTSSLQRASPRTLERLCSGGPSTLESASCGAAPDVPHDAIPHVSSTSQRRPGFATKGPSPTPARVREGVR